MRGALGSGLSFAHPVSRGPGVVCRLQMANAYLALFFYGRASWRGRCESSLQGVCADFGVRSFICSSRVVLFCLSVEMRPREALGSGLSLRKGAQGSFGVRSFICSSHAGGSRVRSFICSRAVRGCVRGVPEEARTVRVERSDDEFRSLGRNTPCASFAEALEQRGFARLPSLREAPASGLSFAHAWSPDACGSSALGSGNFGGRSFICSSHVPGDA